MMMIREVILLIGFLFAFSHSASVSSGKHCRLPISGEYSFFAPLFFTENGKLLKPKSNELNIAEITLNQDETVILSCSPNFFRNRNTDRILTAKCKEGKILIINDVEVNYLNDLSCELRSIEEVLSTVYDCDAPLNRGVKYGYLNPITDQSYVMGESCYSTEEGRTLFAHTKIRQSNITIENVALKIEDIQYFTGAHPSYHNKIEYLKAINAFTVQRTLTELLGIENVPTFVQRHYIGSDLLSDRQLQSTLKFTWNSFLLYDGVTNYDLLIDDIKNLGVFNLEIYTGSHGVLKLKKQNSNEKVAINLRDNKYPVPEIIWIIVKSEDRATAFAIYNNPTMSDDEKTIADSLCTNKCDKISWITNLLENNKYSNKNAGYLMCCDLSSIRNHIDEIPDLVDVVSLFK